MSKLVTAEVLSQWLLQLKCFLRSCVCVGFFWVSIPFALAVDTLGKCFVTNFSEKGTNVLSCEPNTPPISVTVSLYYILSIKVLATLLYL